VRAESRACTVLAFSSAGSAALAWERRTRVDRRASSDLRRKLSERERLILKLIASGHTNQTIADQLNISRKTGETHRMRVMQKLDIHKATDLVRFALTAGILDTL
jgi:two-component system secretion response regulator SsrB